MTDIWEATIKKAPILKPKPPSIKIKPKPKVEPKIGNPTGGEPDDDFEQLHERCMCNWPKCQRKAKYGCHYCSARMCNYHYGQVTDRKVGIAGRPADEIHNFAIGHCEGEEWVWD